MKFSIAFLTVFLAGSPTFAEDPAMVVVSGKCQKLVVGKNDLSAHCSPKLINTSYSNGRVGFYFVVADGSVLTISGMDLPNPTPDTDQFKVDKLILKIGHADLPPTETRASGKCSFGNPYKGKSAVKCSGKLSIGEKFEAAFKTDGRAPQ